MHFSITYKLLTLRNLAISFFFFYLSPDSNHTWRCIVKYSGGETGTLCRPEASPCHVSSAPRYAVTTLHVLCVAVTLPEM